MMRRKSVWVRIAVLVLAVAHASLCCAEASPETSENVDGSGEAFAESCVYLRVANYPYDQSRPWKRLDLERRSAYGCAVSEYEVITTTQDLKDVTHVEARQKGGSDFIPAQVKVIDYESDLCLISLDAERMIKPLEPVTFSEEYREGAQVEFHWLAGEGSLIHGRGYIDIVRAQKSQLSYAAFLTYMVSNTSMGADSGRLFCMDGKPIGLGSWYDKSSGRAGLVPASVINQFLADVADGEYTGFPALGFKAEGLLDPTVRRHLKIPDAIHSGCYVTEVHSIGTGSEELRPGDVILAIEGETIDAYGRFDHRLFRRISLSHLITSRTVGDVITFDVWRDGSQQQVEVAATNFLASDMPVPYYEYGRRPEYVVLGGCVFQKLTRQYLTQWGSDWAGKVSSHLYRYYHNSSFAPSPDRRDIVLLSRVLPADINLGYQDLSQLVVSHVNGRKITRMRDLVEALEPGSLNRYHVISFENDNPTLVILREGLAQADAAIAASYGVTELSYVE